MNTGVALLAAAAEGEGDCGSGLGSRAPPASRSSSSAIVGVAAVSRDTACSCRASVMSTPLICRNAGIRGQGSPEPGCWCQRVWGGAPLTERTRSPTCRVPARWAAPPSAMREMKIPYRSRGGAMGTSRGGETFLPRGCHPFPPCTPQLLRKGPAPPRLTPSLAR